MSIFELCMMICFGFAWPVNLYNSIKMKSTKGKNILFMFVIALAYTFGILHKFFYSYDFVLAFYLINFLMVVADIGLYFVNRGKEKKVNN